MEEHAPTRWQNAWLKRVMRFTLSRAGERAQGSLVSDGKKIDGIHVHWLNVAYSNESGYLSRVFAFLKYALMSGFRAKSVSGDVVFATSTPLTIALPAIYAAKRLNIPMVFEV